MNKRLHIARPARQPISQDEVAKLSTLVEGEPKFVVSFWTRLAI
ncbi:unnamed protein product [Acidithrix sp. C25]|nr:unnamed protein product [Acidithrix sp. C25]